MFPIINVNAAVAEAIEPLGSKRKFWYTNQGKRMLFKAEERGTGEDWAEKIACELTALLGLPHVHYELAFELVGKTPGVVCENCAPAPVSLLLGNQLLLERDPGYPADASNRYKVREHTVDAVAGVLRQLGMPPTEMFRERPEGINVALDVFIGYVMLDAWTANQDRHHENWGALREGGILRLAPTFDHGASMARNLTDEERKDRLTTKDVNRQVGYFVCRARSAFYVDATATKSLTTLEAWQAFSQKSPEASAVWLDRLRSVGEHAVARILAEIPPSRLSNVGREFTMRLLAENRRRLLTGGKE